MSARSGLVAGADRRVARAVRAGPLPRGDRRAARRALRRACSRSSDDGGRCARSGPSCACPRRGAASARPSTRRGRRPGSRGDGARRSARRVGRAGLTGDARRDAGGRPGGMGAGVRTSRGGAGEVGGDARSVARGRMTALASKPLHIRRATRPTRWRCTAIEQSVVQPTRGPRTRSRRPLARPDAVLVAESPERGAGGDAAVGLLGYVVALVVGPKRRSPIWRSRPRRGGGGSGVRCSSGARRAGGSRGADASISRSASRTAARTLYEASGFESVGRRRGYYRRPVGGRDGAQARDRSDLK